MHSSSFWLHVSHYLRSAFEGLSSNPVYDNSFKKNGYTRVKLTARIVIYLNCLWPENYNDWSKQTARKIIIIKHHSTLLLCELLNIHGATADGCQNCNYFWHVCELRCIKWMPGIRFLFFGCLPVKMRFSLAWFPNGLSRPFFIWQTFYQTTWIWKFDWLTLSCSYNLNDNVLFMKAWKQNSYR